ncbi:MAG: MarR family transcriptional regulator [Ruminiclostridium sp.]|nr:MarR family transcriptional regulator [Ruminiclostridium sp.]
MSEMEFGSCLYKLYHSAVKLESSAIEDNKNCTELTVNELNLIEAIRRLSKGSETPTISAIANEMNITRPSTTVAVNKLERKDIVTKNGCEKDGRSVRVKLTQKGEKAYSAHHSYQNTLAKDIKKSFSEEDYKAITTGLSKLAKFFEDSLAK